MTLKNSSTILPEPFPARPEYEQFIYTIVEQFGAIEKSTLHFFTTSPTAGLLKGEILFKNGYRLRIVEVIDFASSEILDYSYSVFDVKNEKVMWFDPQPHPDDISLADTFPHHKHVQPNIKNNRKPAQGISFKSNNLIYLIDFVAHIEKKP